ncbi:MAG: type I DNA topoisomerase [Rickettsiaceae bacterium]|nr:type I DNA topoisomerase [Rickettsiaceae bacterium]
MKLVIVESPSKAKTINKYLGNEYKVIASFGHIRDLPSKNGSVLPEQNFEMKYEIPGKSQKYVTEIVKAAKQADEIFLATDPDREGESISWHVIEILKDKKALKKDCKVKRVAFNEITKKSVLNSIDNPREIDINLVDAQQARRALDYLVGFTLSPILWRKLPGCRSAGRVQSVALRMICDREHEIEKFISTEYWNISIEMLNSNNESFIAYLTHRDGNKLEKLTIRDKKSADEIVRQIESQEFSVLSIQKKQQKRVPAPPFITSSLQQEAARKLGFTAKKTMQVAQKLYEGVEIDGDVVGLITYMRTDGVTLASEAIDEIRKVIQEKYSKEYLPSTPRLYKAKSKNAQEAHEAIRPTYPSFSPDKIATSLTKEQYSLYDLIWKRTIACQMENVILDMVGADLISTDKNLQARATGSSIVFDGFYKVYREGKDDTEDEEGKILPALKENEKLKIKNILPAQHFTQPAPRFTEASLVKSLEELGIGRPSTYASIISVLQDRNYVTVEKKRFFPADLGRLVTAFLTGFFKKYVEYDFTASLEDELDKIAEGEMNWKNLLLNFWAGFNENITNVSQKEISEVIKYVENALDFYLFGQANSKEYNNNKRCKACSNGILSLKLGKYGAFLACNNYPDCTYKKSLHTTELSEEVENSSTSNNDLKELGQDKDGNLVTLRKGPYGWYVQLGDNTSTDNSKKSKVKPKRSTIPPNLDPNNINLELAIKLLSLPIVIGQHAEDQEDIHMGIGKFGPYLKYKGQFISIPKQLDPFSITLKQAEELIKQKKVKT